MNLLKCSKCKQEKQPEDFSINNNNKQRQFRNNYCKQCDSEAHKKKYAEKRANNYTVTETLKTEIDTLTSYRAIATELNCKHDTVIRIEKTAIRKLKSALNQRGIYSASDLI